MENKANKPQFRPMVFVLCLVMVLTLLVSALPQGPAAAQNCKFRHNVQAGDTLSYIANLYQIRWQEIADANKLQPPYVLAVGQVLCIPGGQDPDTGNDNDNNNANDNTNTSGKSGQPSMTVTAGLNNFHLAVDNFLPKTSYYVRVSPRSTGVSYRVGHFTTDKNGDFADFFRLPAFLPRTQNMGVCVKNVWTDAVSCVNYDEVPLYLASLVRIRCSKEAR